MLAYRRPTRTNAAQVEQLTTAGAIKVFSEKASGKNANRPQLQRAIAALDAGDAPMVTRIDRLARSTRDLLNIVHDVKQAGATFKSFGRALGRHQQRAGRIFADHFGRRSEAGACHHSGTGGRGEGAR